MTHILIIEDEPAIADTLVYALEAEGFATTWRQRGGDGLEALQQLPVDLVILDVGLADMSGFEVCRRLRKFSEVPVMFLTARGDEIDRVVGLEIGADDYVVKPFSPREVVARVRAILKRTAQVETIPASVPVGIPVSIPVRKGALTDLSGQVFEVDEARLKISFRQQPLHLTPHEFRLLEYLLRQPERVFSREQLLQAMGVATEAGYDRAIDGHIKSIRAKLRQIDPTADPIQTHRGFGYSCSSRSSSGSSSSLEKR